MQVELRATEALLEKGVRVPVPAPFFLRLFGCKNIHLKVQQPSLGNKLRINELYLKMGIPAEALTETGHEQADRLMLLHGHTLLRIVALGMFKGWLLPKILNRPVAYWLRWQLKSHQVLTLVQLLILFSGTSDFMNTIRLIAGTKITAPNLSQPSQGS